MRSKTKIARDDIYTDQSGSASNKRGNRSFTFMVRSSCFWVDGSKINLPRELLYAGYKAPNKHQHYPQGLMSTLYHLGRLIYDGTLSPDQGERSCFFAHMERLSSGDVLVLDRGYFSYLILVKAIGKGPYI